LFARALEEGKSTVELRYGVTETDSEGVKSFSESLMKRGGRLVRDPDLHAKYVVVDDEIAIISSHNWLNGSEYMRRRPGVEVGIGLCGGTVGKDLLSASSAVQFSTKKSRK
jgi:hypothetical protein